MSERTDWIVELEILPGQLEAFRSVVRDLVLSARKEPGTLVYAWHFNPEQTAAHVHEAYRDSAAILAHGAGFAQLADRFFAACRVTRCTIYGHPSDEAKAALADLQPVYYTRFDGFPS